MKTQLDTKNNINTEHLFKLDLDRGSGKTFGSEKPEFLATSLQHFASISILFIRAVVRGHIGFKYLMLYLLTGQGGVQRASYSLLLWEMGAGKEYRIMFSPSRIAQEFLSNSCTVLSFLACRRKVRNKCNKEILTLPVESQHYDSSISSLRASIADKLL